MSRQRFQGTMRDGYGNVIVNGVCTVFLAGTPTVANIYTAISGGSPVPFVSSDVGGLYFFYVDTVDYLPNQRFDIQLSAPGFDTKKFIDIEIIRLESVSVTSVNGQQGDVVLTASDLGLGNVTNDKQVKAAVSSVNGNVPTWVGIGGDTLSGTGLAVGTGASDLVQLDGSSKLPAVDGSQLTNLPFPDASFILANTVQVLVKNASYTVGTGSAKELYGSVILVGNSGVTITLPNPSVGMSCIVFSSAANVVTVAPSGSNTISINGATKSGGATIVSDGNFMSFVVMIASSSTNWIVLGVGGAWT